RGNFPDAGDWLPQTIGPGEFLLGRWSKRRWSFGSRSAVRAEQVLLARKLNRQLDSELAATRAVVPTINVVVMPKRWIVSDDSVTTESLGVRHRVLQTRADVTLVENIVLANVSRKHPTHA